MLTKQKTNTEIGRNLLLEEGLDPGVPREPKALVVQREVLDEAPVAQREELP